MSRANPLSALGRVSYGVHLLFYPTILGIYILGVRPYLARKKIADAKHEWDIIPPARVVDPDLFNPFSPIPYHNNPELKYGFAHINLHNYTNQNHINVNEYVWKDFHDSYDHNHTKSYKYNWVSVTGPKE
jgi:hypothetical protein